MSEELIPVGTTVRLSTLGHDKYLNRPWNPHNAVGVVVHNDCTSGAAWPYCVEWPDEEFNEYRHGEIEAVTQENDNA